MRNLEILSAIVLHFIMKLVYLVSPPPTESILFQHKGAIASSVFIR